MSLCATKSSAYRAIARAETAAGVDPAQSIALAEGTFAFPQHETDAHVIDAATAYVAVGKDDQLVAALRRIDLDDVGIMRGKHGETMRAELLRAMAMRPKQSLGAIDRFLWARAQELVSGIPAGMVYLELAEAEAKAGIDPRPAVNEALRLSNGFGPELQFTLGLPVCKAGQQLGCDMSAGWKSALRGAKSFQPEQSLASLAVARVEFGLPIGDELKAIDSLTGTGTIRADARSEVAHAIFRRTIESINLLPPAERRRLRRKFGIMEPKES
jgi:hypothetical protein